MNKDEILKIWAPDDSIWSVWIKPVLFAHMDTVFVGSELPGPPHDLHWCPPPEKKVALVVDLPGAEGVVTGIALADRGYRPVPLYNAIPLPGGQIIVDAVTRRNVAAVDILPIISALRMGAHNLVRQKIPPNAPPAFLLDANRQGDGRIMLPDEFDNRSVCFTTDFPSANFMLANGVQSALLVQNGRTAPQPDLAHVLRRWQEGGITLQRIRTDLALPPASFEVPRPSWFGAMFQRVLMAMGLRRSFGGGFGAWIPAPSSGG